jgi:hypothetical protein
MALANSKILIAIADNKTHQLSTSSK